MTPKPTWNERYQHWLITRRLKQLDREFFRSDISDMGTVNRIREESEPLQDRYDLFETRNLQRRADGYCVQIPGEPSWWRELNVATITGIPTFDISISLLTEAGQRNVRKLIREERWRLIKLRVEVLIPVLSLIVAILALAVSVILSTKS